MKACDFIVKYLAETAGVDHVFTFAGGTNAMILDSVVRHGGMKIVPMRHEENVALAADGYSRIKRGIGLALAMSGPGATNMITGIAQSYFDSSPVLYLTGNVTTGTYKYDRPLRQMGYQETDIVSIVRPITKKAFFVDRGDRVAEALRSALWNCVAGRPGPCLYDIPFDIQKLDVPDFLVGTPYRAAETRTGMSAGDYDKFRNLLEHSRRPLILAGGGVQLSGTAPALASFARKHRLPVVKSLLALDAFPGDDPLHVGFIGAYGNRHANRILAAADLVIALGTRIDSRQTANVKEFSANKKIIHVEVDRNVIGSTVETELGIHMDLAHFFEDLQRFEADSPMDWQAPEDWLAAIERVTGILENDTWEDRGDLNPKKFIRKLTLAQPPGTIYTADVGSNQMWTAQCGVFNEGDRVILSGGLGTMGYAIPAGVGAAMAAQGAHVVAITGDGGFQMSIPELSTVREFSVPIKIVVMNNGILGLMKNFQDENFDGRHPATVDGYSVPEVTKVAAAYDLECRKVESDADVDAGLDWLSGIDGPAVLDVRVPPQWSPYPKVMPGSGLTRQRPELAPEVEKAVEEALK